MPTGADYGALILPPPRRREPPRAPQRRVPAPRVYAPARPPQVFKAPLSSKPFAPAVKAGQRRVEAAQRALPQQPVPHIPRLPEPTPHQMHAALTLVAHTQRKAIGSNPSPRRLAQYQQELANDPRLRDFRETVSHYVRAAEGHLAAQGGRGILAGEGANPAGFSRGEQVAIGRGGKLPLIAGNVGAPLRQRQNAQTLALAREGAVPALLAQERREGVGDTKVHLPFATIDLSKVLLKAANVHLGVGGVPGKILNEAIDLPAQTFLSSAIAGSAVRKGVVSGDWKQAKGLGEGILSQIEHPVKSLEDAPLNTALLFAGGENVLGRLAGRVGAAGERGLTDAERISALLHKAPAPARPDLKLYGGERITGRTYNPDPLRKGAQRLYERTLPKLPGDLRQPDPFQAEGWRLKRNLVGGVTKVGRVDRVGAGTEDNRRSFVKGIVHKAIGLKPKVGEHAVPLIVQGIVRTPQTLVRDLAKEVVKLRGAQADLKGSHLKANKANLKNAEALLHDKGFREDPSEAFAAAKRYIALQRPFTAALLHGGKLVPEQVRAALFPYAQAHMGARYFTAEDHAKLGRDSGVNPEAVAEHHALEAAHGDAQQRLAVAREAVKRAENARSRAVGAQRVRPRNARPTAADRRAADGGGTAVDAATARLQGAKAALKVAKQDAAAAADARIPHPKPEAGLRKANGDFLSSEEILEHMRANGVHEHGFISHRTGVAGRSSFFKSSLRQPTLERFGRTGESFLKGTGDHSWEAAVGNIAKQAGEAAQLEANRSRLNRFAIGGPFRTLQLARAAADNFHATPGGEEITGKLGKLVPVHLGTGQILEKGHIAPASTLQSTLEQFGLERHTNPKVEETGHYALVPEKVAKRFQAHDEALSTKGELGRGLQLYQQAFRRAKLNTSFPHIFGVVQEQAIRLAAEGTGRAARAAGAKLNRNLNELAERDKHGMLADTHGPLGEKYREYASTIANRGGLAGSQRANDVVRKGDQFAQTSALGYIVHGAEGAARSRVGEAIGVPWRAWKAVVEGSLSKVEHETRNALLGKALKDSGLIKQYRDVNRATDEAVKALIEGKLDHNMADALAEKIDNMGGNWNRQTPAVRQAVSKYVPFGLWWLNSMRWLYRLPVTHPIKTALAAGLYRTTTLERNRQGQGFDAASPVPNFLQGTIKSSLPLLGKGRIAPSYYSPGGTGGPEALNTAVEQFFPALSSIYASARNQNPLTGNKLTTASGAELKAPEGIANVLAELLAGPIPFATQAQKVLTKGGKPYGTSNLVTDLLSKLGGPSQVKPGTERSWEQVLGKLIAPTRFDFPGAGEVAEGNLPPQVAGAIKAAEQRAKRSGNLPPQVQAAVRRAEAAAKGR